MKNLIEPQILASFRNDPTQLSDMVKFLDNNKEISIRKFCNLIDVHPSKIYYYKSRMKKKDCQDDNGLSVVPKAASKKYNRYSAEEKFVLVEKFLTANDQGTELLRKYGIYLSDINRWKEQIKEASLEALGKRKTRSDKKTLEQVEIEELKKELQEQEKTTAKLSTLLVQQKKTSDLLKKYE